MESDIRYFRRRACEEMGAARRAVTEAARERRLQLVDHYLQRLAALKQPSPFGEPGLARTRRSTAGGTAKGRATRRADPRSAFAWTGETADTRV